MRRYSGIVAYHSVDADVLASSMHMSAQRFEEHINFLAAEADILPLHELLHRRIDGKSLRGCVALTFDDAYAGFPIYCQPLLEKKALPATVFVATAFCEGGRRFWWDRLESVARHQSALVREKLLRELGDDRPVQQKAWRHLRKGDTAFFERLERSLADIEREIGVPRLRALTWPELERVARSALIDFAVHTHSHRPLPALPAPDVASEIKNSFALLLGRLPRVRPILAYPHGLHDRRIMSIVAEQGMQGAVTMQGHAILPWSSRYALPRVGVADVNTIRTLDVRLRPSLAPMLVMRERVDRMLDPIRA